MDDLLAHALVAASVIVAFIQGVSMVWSIRIARALVARPGEELSSLLATMSVALFLAQLIAAARAILIDFAPITSLPTRVALFLAAQVALVFVSVYVMFRARRMEQRQDDSDPH